MGPRGPTREAGRHCPSPEHSGPFAARVVGQSSLVPDGVADVCLSSRGSRRGAPVCCLLHDGHLAMAPFLALLGISSAWNWTPGAPL